MMFLKDYIFIIYGMTMITVKCKRLSDKVTVNHAGSLVTAEEIAFGNQEYIELTDESDLNFLGVDSDFEHLLSGDIPTFDTLDEYINKDGGLTYD